MSASPRRAAGGAGCRAIHCCGSERSRRVGGAHLHDFIVAALAVLSEVAMKKRVAATVSGGEE